MFRRFMLEFLWRCVDRTGYIYLSLIPFIAVEALMVVATICEASILMILIGCLLLVYIAYIAIMIMQMESIFQLRRLEFPDLSEIQAKSAFKTAISLRILFLQPWRVVSFFEQELRL